MAVSITFVIIWDMKWSCLIVNTAINMKAEHLWEMLYVVEGGHISEGSIWIATRELKLNAFLHARSGKKCNYVTLRGHKNYIF